MHFKALVAGIVASFALAGCTGQNMKETISASCGFVANQGDLIKLATKVGGSLLPGGVFAFETAETVVNGVCAAYNAQKAVKRESSIRGVAVKGVYVRRGS